MYKMISTQFKNISIINKTSNIGYQSSVTSDPESDEDTGQIYETMF
jgi:hypothetical protein